MSKEICPEIKESFSLYEQLLNERKNAEENRIVISKQKTSNVNYLEEQTKLTHSVLTNKITLSIVVKKINNKYFSFTMRCKDLSEKPFFGFDSDGARHRNNKEDIPFKDQFVNTPHFNYYDKDGQRLAKQTDKLKDKAEARALEDINLCLVHFCYEGNVRCEDDNFPEVEILKNELEFNEDNRDPNLNIQFS